MTVDEGVEFFSNHPKIYRKLLTLQEVGLGYVKKRQPATTLSGGEAQRVKLAAELSKRSTGKTIYVLDEPTTGLHTADVHKLLEVLAKEQPQIHLLSAAGEQMLQKKEAEKASRKLPESELTDDARHSITVLRRAKEYLEAKPEIADDLNAAERRKRAQLQSKPVYRYVALAIFVMGIVSAAYGLYAVTNHTGGYGIYFALFGFAAIFLFSSYNMLPTARNNNNAIMKRADKAEAAMAEYVKHYPNGAFPVPSCYAHPIVLKQMSDAIEEGRAVTVPEALTAVESRLKSLNADVQVEQEEYDEVVVIKAMFLNHDYQ